MIASPTPRRDGWTAARRVEFLGALRVTGRVAEACAWAGPSASSAYRLRGRDAGFAAAWDKALAARDADRRPVRACRPEQLSDRDLLRLLSRADRHCSAPRGCAQQKARSTSTFVNIAQCEAAINRYPPTPHPL